MNVCGCVSESGAMAPTPPINVVWISMWIPKPKLRKEGGQSSYPTELWRTKCGRRPHAPRGLRPRSCDTHNSSGEVQADELELEGFDALSSELKRAIASS